MTIQPSLEDRLALLDVEPNEAGRLGARARVAKLSRSKKKRSSRGWLLAGGAAALFMLTPPGQSIADAVGDLVGIGGEPTGGPQFGNPGETRKDTVIAVGQTSSGKPFELVATNPDKPAPGPGPELDVTCVYTNFPESRPQNNLGQCLNAGVLSKLAEGTRIEPAAAVVPGEEGGGAPLVVNAYATPDIASLGLVVDGTETPMTSGILEPVSASGGTQQVRYGAGFVPAESLDYARLLQMAAPLGGSMRERPEILVEGSTESMQALDLLGGIQIIGYDADGSELLRRGVVTSPAAAFGVLMSMANPAD